MKKILMSFLAVTMLLPVLAQAADKSFAQFATALRGYDAVAYQTESKAVQGNGNHAIHHDGLTYLFSSKKNAKTFKKNPEQYVPAYNGYCAFGVSKGKKFSTDPEAFKVVDGKLYMNLNKKVQKLWLKDVPGNITSADEQWTDIEATHPDEL